MMLPEYRRRYRTSTAEMAPFWRAQALYRHDPSDSALFLAEWGSLGLGIDLVRLLTGAGFSCYRAIPPCPDWLLASVPGLGPTKLAALRHILPSSREIYQGPLCPGRVIENSAALATLQHDGLDGYLAEQARREIAGEPELLGTEAVLSSFSRPEP